MNCLLSGQQFLFPNVAGQYTISTSVNDVGSIFEFDHANDIVTMHFHVS